MAMPPRKKPLTRKTPLRAKAPFRSKAPLRTKPGARSEDVAGEAVQKLWPLLAERAGPPFTQYARIGPYVADFACPAAKLVILLTGDDDSERTGWFEAQGWRVFAFAADAVARDPGPVLDAVADAFSLRLVKR